MDELFFDKIPVEINTMILLNAYGEVNELDLYELSNSFKKVLVSRNFWKLLFLRSGYKIFIKHLLYINCNTDIFGSRLDKVKYHEYQEFSMWVTEYDMVECSYMAYEEDISVSNNFSMKISLDNITDIKLLYENLKDNAEFKYLLSYFYDNKWTYPIIPETLVDRKSDFYIVLTKDHNTHKIEAKIGKTLIYSFLPKDNWLTSFKNFILYKLYYRV